VEQVSWDDAKQYCAVIGGRLPTEAEWEYGARGGSIYARYGNLHDIAWYAENSGNSTHPVGQKKPNGFGLYDMIGNVWEWTADWYGKDYYQSRVSRDPQGPSSGEFRVIRGGSWGFDSPYVRASIRGRYQPAQWFDFIGLRCAVETGVL
jgi:sulfatase modifying factor 1